MKMLYLTYFLNNTYSLNLKNVYFLIFFRLKYGVLGCPFDNGDEKTIGKNLNVGPGKFCGTHLKNVSKIESQTLKK